MRNLRYAVALVFALVITASRLHAAPLYWDADGTAAGDNPATGAGLGGSGNWDQVSTLWFNGSSDIAWTNANNDDAIFSGTVGTNTLMENISVGNVYFTNTTGNYLITNATGVEVLTIAGAIDTGGGEHTIAAPIANTTTLTKNGGGRLHLPVDNGASLTGTVVINKGDVSVENNNGAGENSISVADGAALVLDGGTNGLTAFYPNVTINGSGITNSGSLRNLTGVTTFYGQITLGENNSVIYADTDSALVYDGSAPITDNGSNYNLIISGNGTGNVHLGETSIGGTLIVEGPATCYAYLDLITPTAWTSTYIGPGATIWTENSNSFGTSPAALMTTNVILDGGTIVEGASYTMWPNDGITITTNGGIFTNAAGTWTTGNTYSQSNMPLVLTGGGSFRPGGAAGATLGTINLGTGAIIKGGTGDCNMGYANPALEIYSNLVVNGGSVTFNYDQANGTSSLGALPATLNASNIILNGGSLHVGHTTTIGATRGIYVGSGGGTIEDVTSGGTATVAGPISGPGNMSYPLGKSGSTTAVVLSGNNTYTGISTIGASCTVTVGAGGTTGTLGAGNTVDNWNLTFNRTGSYTYGGVISGSGWIVKNASGTVTLTGANTYTGNTTNGGGTLLINNTSGSGTGSGSVYVNGGALGGSGTISGAVTVGSGGALALGLSTLTINNNLNLVGSVTVSVNKSLTPSNGMAVVSGTITRTGTGAVTVNNLGPALAAGDTFQLFSQPVSGGGSMAISGGGTGVVWVNNLAMNGTISVQSVSVPTPPGITQVQVSGGNIILSGTNGPGDTTYYVLTATNLTLPLSQWTRISTNSFPGNGQFSVTNPVTPGDSQQFYLLQAQ